MLDSPHSAVGTEQGGWESREIGQLEQGCRCGSRIRTSLGESHPGKKHLLSGVISYDCVCLNSNVLPFVTLSLVQTLLQGSTLLSYYCPLITDNQLFDRSLP